MDFGTLFTFIAKIGLKQRKSPSSASSAMARNDGDGGVSLTTFLDVYNLFLCGFVVAQILGVVCIVIVCLWITRYLGGFGWNTPAQAFNYHPLMMVIGMVVVYGNG